MKVIRIKINTVNQNQMKTPCKITGLIVTGLFFIMCGTLSAQNKRVPFQEVKNIPEGKALVYIYRPGNMSGAAYHYSINANDQKVSEVHLYNDTYLVYYADPGKYEFWLICYGKKNSVNLGVYAGKTYYIEVKGALLKVVPAEK
ncbi:MAG: DUF2846 domain-containing protein, partial [Bacteroidales bacterium]|nr:DUF2846 domain-containing protein [Bacteroidales bacterium]